MNVSPEVAKYFYEQCAGSHSGHMANIPNHPVLYGLVAAHSGSRDSCHAASQRVFAEFLQEAAKQLLADPDLF